MKVRLGTYFIFLGCAVLLSLFTVFVQVKALGIPYLQDNQLRRHQVVLEGTAFGHWQYRVLSEYLVEAVIVLFTRLQLPYPLVGAFIVFRIIQNIMIFFLAGLYYQKLGLPSYHAVIGLSLLAWGMSHALYDSDLQFSTYSDIIFYLLAGIVIAYKHDAWILLITGLAALNRGTSGLIPFMLGVGLYFEWRHKGTLDHQKRKTAIIAVASLTLYFFIIIGLRQLFGPRPPFYPYGKHFGSELFVYNVARIITWVQLFATLGFLPILSFISIRRWPVILRQFMLAIVPIWFAIHPFFSVMAEARNFLVPYALIFVPGTLFGLIPGTSTTYESKKT